MGIDAGAQQMVSRFIKLITKDTRCALLEAMSLSALRRPHTGGHATRSRRKTSPWAEQTPNFLGASHGSPFNYLVVKLLGQ
jgi:hypothetical protein